MEQSRRGLDALLSDAEIAQKALADLFAGLSKGGLVVNPGVKSRARIEEKARSRQKDNSSPPYLLGSEILFYEVFVSDPVCALNYSIEHFARCWTNTADLLQCNLKLLCNRSEISSLAVPLTA